MQSGPGLDIVVEHFLLTNEQNHYLCNSVAVENNTLGTDIKLCSTSADYYSYRKNMVTLDL